MAGRKLKGDDRDAIKGRSYRFGNRYRFALKLASRQTGKSETAILEDAIQEIANSIVINKKHWLEFYDEEDGVAALRLLAQDEYRADLGDEEIRRFTAAYPQYFFADKEMKTPRRAYVKILWPKLRQIMSVWRETRNEDPTAVTKEMVRLLKAGGEKELPALHVVK